MTPPRPGGSDPLSSRPANRTLADRLQRAVRELDAAYTVASAPDDERLDWRIDTEPLVVAPEEWARIEAAVRQRALLINALLSDLYHKQEVLKLGILPPELVLGDPFFRRACVGLEPGRESPATLVRFDLVRTGEDWEFRETFANTPIGTAFAVQTRRLLLQERAGFFAELPEFRRIIHFPVRLHEKLRRLARGNRDNPTVVVLTTGPHDPVYLEHSFLARKMGVPLAQGGDLLVLDQRVYFKTVAGLVPVDVIYRRINDSETDPVVFPTDKLTGVPGLLGSIRAGHVVVANAIGAGIADNRALEAHLPQLLRYFLGERPLLPGATTYYCGDVDQRAIVHDDDGSLELVPAQSSDPRLPAWTPGRPAADRARARAAMLRAPHAYVARAPARAASHPARGGARRQVERRLSCFALCEGRRIDVLPGGMLRLLPTRRRTDPPPWQPGWCADLVVLAARETGPVLDRPPAERVRPLLLGSRAADNLFWAGRYTERAEATARILSIVRDVGIEEASRRERLAWHPVWRGILEATGHGHLRRPRGRAWFTPSLLRHMTLDAANPASLLSTVRAARANTLGNRDFFSPETLGVLNRLDRSLEDLAAAGHRGRATRDGPPATAVLTALDGLAAFFGTLDRTMLHDIGWHFFQIGVHLERAMMTGAGLRHVLAEAETAARSNRREEADLGSLVRMLSSQDAYRRTYQARAEPLFVAEFFLTNRHAPKSIFACLARVRDSLSAISALTGLGDDAPLPAARALLDSLTHLDLDRHFAQRTDSPRLEAPEDARAAATLAVGRLRAPADGELPLAERLDALLEGLEALAGTLHDFYLSHQSRIAPPAPAAP